MVLRNRSGIQALAVRPDARVPPKKGGMSRAVGPILDSIGSLEQMNASLTDVALEILNLSIVIGGLEAAFAESNVTWAIDFAHHCRFVFARRFAEIDNDLLFLALFLHPLCRKLAVSDTPGSRTLDDAKAALMRLIEKWGFGVDTVLKFVFGRIFRETHALTPSEPSPFASFVFYHTPRVSRVFSHTSIASIRRIEIVWQ